MLGIWEAWESVEKSWLNWANQEQFEPWLHNGLYNELLLWERVATEVLSDRWRWWWRLWHNWRSHHNYGQSHGSSIAKIYRRLVISRLGQPGPTRDPQWSHPIVEWDHQNAHELFISQQYSRRLSRHVRRSLLVQVQASEKCTRDRLVCHRLWEQQKVSEHHAKRRRSDRSRLGSLWHKYECFLPHCARKLLDRANV